MPDPDTTKARQERIFNTDFEPLDTPAMQNSPEIRSAAALEYIAYQLGKIRKLMEEKP